MRKENIQLYDKKHTFASLLSPVLPPHYNPLKGVKGAK